MHRIEGENIARDDDGKFIFTDGPPGTTVPAAWLNSVQEEIASVIEGSGITLNSAAGDSNNQLYSSILRLVASCYDAVISSQGQLNDIVERVAANRYQIKSDYKAIFIRSTVGDYALASATSYLSGGDTWGYLETNQASLICCEPDAGFNFGDTIGYVRVNTDDAVIHNMHLKGTASAPAALTRSFLLAANRVLFFSCKVSDRLANSNFTGFEGSLTAIHNDNSKYVGCSVESLTSSATPSGFDGCKNISDCYVYDLESTATAVYGFFQCDQLSNCIVSKLDNATANDAVGFQSCNQISNCYTTDLDGLNIRGFSGCKRMSGCYAFDLQATGGDARGFLSCSQMSGCYAKQIDSDTNAYGFNACLQMSACLAEDIDGTGGNATGFYNSTEVTGCRAYDIAATGAFVAKGFDACLRISACQVQQIDSSSGNAIGFNSCSVMSSCFVIDVDADSGDAYGIYLSTYISSSYATDIDSASGTAEGIKSCTHIAAAHSTEASNTGNDWINTDDGDVTNKWSIQNIFT